MSDIPPPPPPPPPGSPSTSPSPSLPPPPPRPGFGGPTAPAGPPPYASAPAHTGAPQPYPYSDMGSASTGRSGKAVAGFVLGLCSIVLFLTVIVPVLAIVFGLLGAKEIKRSAGRRTRLAMARIGWILGALGLIGGALFWVFVGSEIAGTTSVSSLEVGDCVDLPADDVDEISRLEHHACDQPHDAEVFSVGDLGDGDQPYPGENEIDGLIAEQCIPDFQQYIGTPYGEGELDVYRIYPVEDNWQDYQSYQCLAVQRDGGKLTQTVEGSNR